MSDYQLIDVTLRGSAVVISIRQAHLTTAIAAEILGNELQQVIADIHPRVMVLDFSDVKIVSSSTIGTLLSTHQRMQKVGGQLHLCCVSIPIAEVYRTLGLDDRHLMVFDTVEQAVNTRVVATNEDREIMED